MTFGKNNFSPRFTNGYTYQPVNTLSWLKGRHNAKFGVVRAEQFYMGFYANGNTVAAPVSPVDGYAYSYAECLFFLIHSSSLSPAAGFVPGQALFPPTAPNAAPYRAWNQWASSITRRG